MFDRVFEALFKYRPVVYEQGDLAFAPPWPGWIPAAAVLAAAVLVVWSHMRGRSLTSKGAPGPSGRPAGRIVLRLGLRLAVLAALLVALMRPVLVVRAVEPQRNVLGVLIDDSRSMTVADLDEGRPRSRFVTDALASGAPLRAALESRFTLRFYRFAASTSRVDGPGDATFDGTRSLVGQALQRTADGLAGLPASGVVVFTDGADTGRSPAADTVLALRAAGLPVFAVGLGRERLAHDVQLGRVDPPMTVLKGATLVVEVLVSQAGYAGRTVPLIVEDEGRNLVTQDVTLPPDGEPATVPVRFTLDDAGARLLTFRIPPQPDEAVAQNNARQALVVVEDRRDRVLYVEGEPRPEMKFLRQAVAADRNLQVVTLQRTASRKFLRLDIDDASELAGGFPATRDELFAYRGLVLGSIEAAAFTPDQLQMMADFAGLRGGGLLALGGRRAFAEGGYAGTPLGEALPVQLEAAAAAEGFLREVRVRPTRAGLGHVVTQLGDARVSAPQWTSLPALTAVNPVARAKPGATVLLEGVSEGEGASAPPHVVMAYHRYGAGTAIAVPVQDTWLWQMHADMAVEDQTHETFWRRTLRWLVSGVPGPVEVSAERERAEPGDTVSLTAMVRDAGFLGVNDASVRATVTGPDGGTRTVDLAFALDEDGEYRGALPLPVEGLYEIRIDATRAGATLGTDRTYVRAAAGDDEYFDAGMRRALLERLAADTGGRFYTPATAPSLPDDLTYLGRGVTVLQQKDLWDMPAALVALVALLGAEWFLRRREGLP